MQKVTVIGEDQHSLGFQIQTTGRENPGIDDPLWQHVHYCQPTMGVMGTGDGSRSFVKHDGQVFGWLDLFPVEDDLVPAGDDADTQVRNFTIDVDEAFFDKEFGSSAGSVATAGQVFLESFSGHDGSGA